MPLTSAYGIVKKHVEAADEIVRRAGGFDRGDVADEELRLRCRASDPW